MASATSINKVIVTSCTVVYEMTEEGVKINPLLSERVVEFRLVMSPAQILYRDQLNRENTATRMRQRMLNQLSKQNGSN